MSVIRLQQKNYQLEDRVMEGYAVAYRAYLARRDLPGPSAITRSRAHESVLTRAGCEIACHLGLRRGDERGPEMFDLRPSA
jgi:hypothetical protein